ncbi:hypothetical protein FRB96_005125 [Tulasnella sp. 330]|nr:hypothetical protein FRB96_005125 [Tulasnella sp. 330]
MNSPTVITFIESTVEGDKTRYSNPEPNHDAEKGMSTEKPARPPLSPPAVDANPAYPKNLDFEVPSVVETLRQGRLSSCNAAAVVSALFAGIEATMISVIKGSQDPGHGNANTIRLLLILSYAGLIFNASTTFTALLLIDRLGNLTFMSMKAPATVTTSSLQTGRRLLGRFGASGVIWNIMEFHYFTTLIMGSFTIFSQLAVYCWVHESGSVAIIASCCIGFSIIPFALLFMWQS